MQKAKSTLRYGLKLAAKAGVAWLMRTNLDSFDQIVQDSARQALDDGSNVIIDGLIQDYEETQKDIDTLKELLKKITKDKKVVMFVDELDRCKPRACPQSTSKFSSLFIILSKSLHTLRTPLI